jgi:hypothetical protein
MTEDLREVIQQEMAKHLIVIEEFLRLQGIDISKSVATLLLTPVLEITDDYIIHKEGVLLLSTSEDSEVILDQLDHIREGILDSSSPIGFLDIEMNSDEDGNDFIEDIFSLPPKKKP